MSYTKLNTAIMRVIVTVDHIVEYDVHLKKKGNPNVLIESERNKTNFILYCAGREDKENFVTSIRNLYPNDYIGYSAVILNMSPALTEIISKGESL